MDRREYLLRGVTKDLLGIEVGPSHSPLAPKCEGYRTLIVDSLNREELIKKYTPHGVDLSRIEEVDHVWKGERYRELLGNDVSVSWIIASHVIEHTPDFIGFLNSCAEVLVAGGGRLNLAIPDKRFCFDRFRPVSGLAQVVDRHLAGAKRHTAGSAAEFLLNAVSSGDRITWAEGDQQPFKFLVTDDSVLGHFAAVRKGELDMDVHAWCFTPSSFRLLLRDLNFLGLTSLRVLDVSPSFGHEFFATLVNDPAVALEDRRQILGDLDREHRPPPADFLG